MKINGGVKYIENGLTASLRAMHVQSELIGMTNENVSGFDKVGYQRRDPVVSSFTEFLGVHGLSSTVDDQVGRIAISPNPLDLALATKGYFQTQSKDGIKLTRDGRFKVDKDGNFLLEKVSLGRQSVQITYIGYKPASFQDIILNSVKEAVVDVELEESVIVGAEIEVKAASRKDETINRVAVVSARSFTVE